MAPDEEHLIHLTDESRWEPAELFGLPSGCEYQIISQDEEKAEMVLLCRFPPGYEEPRHEHEAEHWSAIVAGEMHVSGKVLRAGDVFYGPAGEPHGPFKYTPGCTIFGVVRGGSILHRYDETEVGGDDH